MSWIDLWARKTFPQPTFLNSPNIQQWRSFKSSVKHVSPKPAFHLYLGPGLPLLASEVLEFLTYNLSRVALSLKPTLFASKNAQLWTTGLPGIPLQRHQSSWGLCGMVSRPQDLFTEYSVSVFGLSEPFTGLLLNSSHEQSQTLDFSIYWFYWALCPPSSVWGNIVVESFLPWGSSPLFQTPWRVTPDRKA